MKPLRFALLGEEIGYTRSPEIFAQALAVLGREGRLEVRSTSRERLGVIIHELVEGGCNGFAVTVPHKEAVIEHLDALDANALSIGAVNSVAVDGRQLIGYNTDCDGFTFMLKRSGFSHGRRAMLLGCGGVARATAWALAQDFQIRNLVVVGRDSTRLSRFADYLRHTQSFDSLETVSLSSGQTLTDLPCDLLINCTPAGGPNHIEESPLPAAFDWSAVELYCDLNYNADNPIVAEAERHGIKAVDGSAMLVAQALRSLDLWTGLKADFETVYSKVFATR